LSTLDPPGPAPASSAPASLLEIIARESPVGIFQAGDDGAVTHCNAYFAERMGLSAEEVSGHSWWRILHPSDRPLAAATLKKCVNQRREVSADLRFRRRDGSLRWCTLRVAPLPANGETEATIVGTIVDTTRRKKMELGFAAVSVTLARCEGEDLYRRALLHAAQILEVEIVLLAVPSEGGKARTLAAVVDGAVVDNFEYEIARTPCANVLEWHARVYASGVRELFPDDPVAVEMGVEGYAGVVLMDPLNEPIGILAVASRSELKDAEELPALLHLFAARLAADLDRRRSEAGFRDLFEFAPDALMLCDRAWLLTQVNRHAEELFGYRRDELVGMPLDRLVSDSFVPLDPNRDAPRPAGAWSAAALAGAEDLLGRRRDGTLFPVEVSLSSITTAKGPVTVTAIRDVSARIQLERTRLQRENLLRLRLAIEEAFTAPPSLAAAAEAVSAAIGRSLDVADVHLRIDAGDEGLPPVEAWASGPATHHDPASAATHSDYPLRIGERHFGSLRVEGPRPFDEDTVTGLLAAASAISAHLGRLAAETGLRTLADELEQRVRDRTRELETANRDLDAFAASVSHDLRSPIRRIQGFAALLRESLGDRLDASDAKALDALLATSRDMGSIVAALLQVAGAGRAPLRTRAIVTNSVVDQVLHGLLGAEDGRRIDVTVDPLPVVNGDPTLIRQVFENLLSNAVKYTRGREVAEIRVDCEAIDGGYARLRVRDNGIGFDMSESGRLFEMFSRRQHEAD
jgi:PAS domain S-box-containing protein